MKNFSATIITVSALNHHTEHKTYKTPYIWQKHSREQSYFTQYTI